jgi:hypothetical protein
MSDKEKKLIAEMKKAVPAEKSDALDVANAQLTDDDLDTVSGGLTPAGDVCACLCGQGTGCSGGGGG